MSNRFNERSVEYPFALGALRFIRGPRIVDVGVGRHTLLASMLKQIGFRVSMTDKSPAAREVVQDDISSSRLDSDAYDATFCISVLEHVHDFDAGFGHLARVTKPGGIIILTTPYCHDQFVADVYKLPGVRSNTSAICRLYSDVELDRWRISNALEILDQAFWKAWTGKLWRQGPRYGIVPVRTSREDAHLQGTIFRKPELSDQ